jgi:hypothetical protein
MDDLGRRIAAARAYAGEIGRAELAARISSTEDAIKQLEAGVPHLDETTRVVVIKAIADACGLPYAFFTVNWEEMPDLLPQAASADLEARVVAIEQHLGIGPGQHGQQTT